MLKKQTVWLLTMLSLMIVLSVYYLISDKEDFAYVKTDNEVTEESMGENSEGDIEVEGIEQIKSNELFTMIRMELEDERSMKKDRLKEIVASSNATTTEINNAMNEIEEIESVTTKERILQETIQSQYEKFEEVLVRAEDNIVHVHVIADKLAKKEANQIMQAVKDEMGEIPVDVNIQANNE